MTPMQGEANSDPSVGLMVSDFLKFFSNISLWQLNIPWAWPVWTPGEGLHREDLCRAPLGIATY